MTASVVGIDIGRAALRAVEVSYRGKAKPKLLRYCEIPIPAGAVSRGEVLEPNTVAAALKKLWSTGGFKSKDVALGMGNHRVVARDLTVPKMSKKRIRESLPFQVQDLLSVPVGEALLDFYPISETAGEGDSGPQLNGLLIAAVKEAVLENVKAVQLAGLTPVEVDLIPFALSRSIHRGAKTEDAIVQIDIGAGTTSVVITAAGVPQFVRLIPAGGDDLTQALMVRLGVDEDAAEVLKRSHGLGATLARRSHAGEPLNSEPAKSPLVTAPDSVPPNEAAAQIIRELTSELLNSLRNTVTYFTNTRHNLNVTRILLTGGGAQLFGFAAALAELTRLPVVAPKPVGVLPLGRGVDAEALEKTGGTYLVALGLALGVQP